MRRLAVLVICFVAALPALAQRGGRGGFGGGGGGSFGGGSRGGVIGRSGGGSGSGSISSRPSYRYPGPSHGNPGYQRPLVPRHNSFGWGWGYYPYAGYPYYGNYGTNTYIDTYPSPNYDQYTAGPQVIINQNYTEERHQPVLREVSPPPYIEPQEPTVVKQTGQPSYFLIAFRDSQVKLARSYWVDGNVLRYITRDNIEHEAPLGNVDRELSTQLNAERQVSFSLP